MTSAQVDMLLTDSKALELFWQEHDDKSTDQQDRPAEFFDMSATCFNRLPPSHASRVLLTSSSQSMPGREPHRLSMQQRRFLRSDVRTGTKAVRQQF